MSLQVLAANAVPQGSFDENNTLHSEFRELSRFSSYDNPLEGEFPSTPVAIDNVLKHLSFQNGFCPTETCLLAEITYNPKDVSEILRRIPEELLADFVNLKDKHGDAALNKAARLGHANAVRAILAGTSEQQRSEIIHQKDSSKITPLEAAACRDHLEVIQELLKNNNFSIKEHERAVYGAVACRSRLEIVQALLQSGNISRKWRGDSLVYAAKDGSIEFIQELLRSGNISDRVRGNAVLNAARRGHLEIVQMLLRSGNISDRARGNAVVFAAPRGHLEVIQELLRSGDISRQDCGDAVIYAAKYRNLEMVKELLRNGVISRRARGDAVAHVARHGDLEIVQELLKDGNIPDKDRESAIRKASQEGHSAVVQVLSQSSVISAEHSRQSIMA